jgi:hypothetical protein
VSAASHGPDKAALDRVAEILDPVLTPLGFAAGQSGASRREGQVIFCRGWVAGIDDGCVDLVIDLVATPTWRITDVRYWGFSSDRWHLSFDDTADLAEQLDQLAPRLPIELG